jgi:hypothetical protein
MRCDEIKERLVEILCDERGTSAESVELREHLRECPDCLKEIQDLRQTQDILRRWKDEPPLRSTRRIRAEDFPPQKVRWKYMRYAAIAAMAVMGFLALANTRIAWNKDGFSFSTGLFSARATDRDYYSKAEVRDILKRALDESESHTNEANYLMMQKILDTVEQDRWRDLLLIRRGAPGARTSN